MPLPADRHVSMLQDISSSYQDLMNLIKQIPAERLVAPNTIGGWSGRDTIAHLANWEAVLINQIEALDRGAVFEWPTKRRDNDTVNEEMLEQSRGMSVDDVLAYFEDTHFKLMELLETSDSVEQTLALAVTVDHYGQHAANLFALLG